MAETNKSNDADGEPTSVSLLESQSIEAGLAKAVAMKRAEIWVKENSKAFESWNEYLEKNGLPLAKCRRF